MQLASVRSGLPESFDEVAAIAVDATGSILLATGPIDEPFYYRSAIKPIQSLAARRTGLDLPVEHLALSCASHTGYPVHIAIARQILADAGLSESDLQTTPDRPSSRVADADLIARGDTTKRSILHNCSGKHSAWLAACAHAGWDTATYLDQDHPIQEAIVDTVHEFTDVRPDPIGVDGCGAPTLGGTLLGLATAFQRLDTTEELKPIRDAMTRFSSLVGDNMAYEGRVGAVWGGPQKGGAAGSFAMARSGVGIATKSRSGNNKHAVMAAVHVADKLGMVTQGMKDALQPQFAPPVIGAGRHVGTVEVVAW